MCCEENKGSLWNGDPKMAAWCSLIQRDGEQVRGNMYNQVTMETCSPPLMCLHFPLLFSHLQNGGCYVTCRSNCSAVSFPSSHSGSCLSAGEVRWVNGGVSGSLKKGCIIVTFSVFLHQIKKKTTKWRWDQQIHHLRRGFPQHVILKFTK